MFDQKLVENHEHFLVFISSNLKLKVTQDTIWTSIFLSSF